MPIYLPGKERKDIDPFKVLVADVGGTKTYVALFEFHHNVYDEVETNVYSSKHYDSLEEIFEIFLTGMELPDIISIGAAGPVINNKIQITNLDWGIDRSALEKSFGASDVSLLNDLEATAFGIAALK